MRTIKRNKLQWELNNNATEKDADTLNRAANRAVQDVLVEMQKEGVTISDALNTALTTAHLKFAGLAHVGALDVEALYHLKHEIFGQFRF